MLLNIVLSAVLASAPCGSLVSSLHPESNSGIELSELVRSSEQIVLGRIERVVALERRPSNVHQPEDQLIGGQKRWQGMRSIPIAELKVERTFKGRKGVTSLWFLAGERTGGGDRPAAVGDHLLLFFGEYVHFSLEGHDFNQRVLELTRDFTVFDVVSCGSMTVSDGSAPGLRCPLEVILPTEVRVATTVDRTGRDVPSVAFEAALKDAVGRQMPIVHAFGFMDDDHGAPWGELRVYGDRRCVVGFTSPSRVTKKSFDLLPEWFEWLAKKIESERFFDLPERIGEDHPDDMDFARIDVTTLERTKVVIFHVPPHRTPSQDAALLRPLSLMSALRNLATDPKAVDPNGRAPVSSDAPR